jgi:hypothetical protein
MPTDSIVERRAAVRAVLRGLVLAVLLWQCAGCIKPPAVVVEDLLVPLAPPKPWLPAPADLAAARLARAALASSHGRDPQPESAIEASRRVDPEVERALIVLEGETIGVKEKNLLPLAIDLRNATFDDPLAYRAASRELRKRRGLDPRIKSRLDRTIDDSLIHLARRRIYDGWERLWARSFNAVSEPLGNSLITGFVLAPYQLANSLVHYFAEFSNNEPLSLTERQALALRQEFLARYPNTELTPELEEKVAKSVILLEKTLALRRVRAADNALDAHEPRLALHQATTAIEILSHHPDENARLRKRAVAAEGKAAERVAEIELDNERSLEARVTSGSQHEAELRLSARLLSGPVRSNDILIPLAEYEDVAGKKGRDQTEFILALAQHESGFESAARKRLSWLAGESPDHHPMARHAAALIESDWQNPYGAFVRLRSKAERDELAWRLAGEWVNRPRYPNIPAPIAYLIDAPTIAITIILAPLRALISPWTGSPDFRRAPALAGYRYLNRYPDGEEQRQVIDWLYGYETDLKHWGRALRLADLMPEFSAAERTELVEKTAEDQLQQVALVERRDSRASLLKGVAREFPDSKGGHDAGLQARADYEDSSPQHIRITKGFLIENPAVAGPSGVGLNPRLLNGNLADGELHPDGLILRGGRMLEILLIAEGSDAKDLPEAQLRRISRNRLTQLAATLDEAVQTNSLIDTDARQAADASRDVFLERAGLGLTEDVDLRPTAESTFVYQSLRERYGLVRGRDSVLPFDLVFQGSVGTFTLGAFPRWRMPAETPDAFLYR